MRTTRLGAVAVSLAAALAIAACGSSSSSSSSASAGGGGSTGTSSGSKVSPATLNGAGSTLAQPIYQQWGSNLKSQGLIINGDTC